MARKTKKATENERNKILSNKKTKYQDLPCKTCGKMQYDVPGDVVAITCWLCVAKDVGFPEPPKPKSTKPKGWHFRKVFVDEDGTVFHKGVEQPELFNTLPPTKVRARKPKAPKEPKKTMNDMVEEELHKISERKKRNKKNQE